MGYTILYQNKDNEIEYKTNSNQEKISLHKIKENAKTHWIDDELQEFFTNGKEYIENNKHDSCIFILSSHGEAEGVIINSEGEEVLLESLFNQYMGNHVNI